MFGASSRRLSASVAYLTTITQKPSAKRLLPCKRCWPTRACNTMKDLTQHIETLRTLAALASLSTDLNMRSKAATIEWLADEFERELAPPVKVNVRVATVTEP